MYIYDIFLDDELVGDSGDEIFDSECQAKLDADEYITYLSGDRCCKREDFEVVVYDSDFDYHAKNTIEKQNDIINELEKMRTKIKNAISNNEPLGYIGNCSVEGYSESKDIVDSVIDERISELKGE